jgi:hypothetical protein
MVHVVVVLRNGGHIVDSNFMVVEDIPEPEEGWSWHDEKVRVVKNPVRILEKVWQSPRIVGKAREVWCQHWVLDCNSGSIVLDNDWSSRSPMRRLALEKVGK